MYIDIWSSNLRSIDKGAWVLCLPWPSCSPWPHSVCLSRG